MKQRRRIENIKPKSTLTTIKEFWLRKEMLDIT